MVIKRKHFFVGSLLVVMVVSILTLIHSGPRHVLGLWIGLGLTWMAYSMCKTLMLDIASKRTQKLVPIMGAFAIVCPLPPLGFFSPAMALLFFGWEEKILGTLIYVVAVATVYALQTQIQVED